MAFKILSGLLVRDVGVHHGVTSNFGSAKVCSPAMFDTSFSYDRDKWIAAINYCNALLHNCAISMDSYSPINKFYSSIIFSLLINAVILLLDIYLDIYIFFPLDVVFST